LPECDAPTTQCVTRPKSQAREKRENESKQAATLRQTPKKKRRNTSEIFYTAVFMPSCRKTMRDPGTPGIGCDAMIRKQPSNAEGKEKRLRDD
jgi:hypothetical protein